MIASIWILCGTVFALAWFDQADVRIRFAAWLTAAGWVAVGKKLIDNPRGQSLNDWVFYGGMSLFIVFRYSVAVYPVLRPHFGGGGPREVALEVDGPSGPETMNVLLIDKVESGYYYIQKNEASGERPTYFIPLDRVQRVTFARHGRPTSKASSAP